MYDVYIAAVNIVVTVMIYNRCNQLCIHVYGLLGVCSMFTHGLTVVEIAFDICWDKRMTQCYIGRTF